MDKLQFSLNLDIAMKSEDTGIQQQRKESVDETRNLAKQDDIKHSESDDFDSTDKNDISIDDLLNALPLDMDKKNRSKNDHSTESSISEDIKQTSAETDNSENKSKNEETSDIEQDRSLNSLDLSDLAIPNFRESEVASLNDNIPSPTKIYLNKSPTSPLHLSKDIKPQETTFELELNPEIKFDANQSNVSPVDKLMKYLETNTSETLSLGYCKVNKTSSNKEFSSMDNIVVPELNLQDINMTNNAGGKSKSSEINNISQPDFVTMKESPDKIILDKDDSNGVNCQYRDIDPQNIEGYSAREGTLMQSLLDSIDTGTTSTEYKIMCEEFTTKVLDYQTAVSEKDHLINKLTQSLQESLDIRKELKSESETLRNEIKQLKEQLNELQTKTQAHNSPSTESLEDPVPQSTDNDNIFKVLQSAHITSVLVNSDLQKFAKTLPPMQRLEFDDIKYKFQILVKHEKEELKQKYEEEIKGIKDSSKAEKQELENEISRLRQALCEFKDSGMDILQIKKHLQEQHKQEVEDLRTYFEKKCADMEKHYSEEVFSQQSRRVSAGSSTDSDIGDLLYNQGSTTKDNDFLRKYDEKLAISPIKSDCKAGGDTIENNPEYLQTHDSLHESELESLQNKFDKKLSEITAQYDLQLRTIEQKYQQELAALKLKITDDQNSENMSEALQEVLLQSENQLQQQIDLVRQEVLNTLEEQIKTLLSDKSEDQSAWPIELRHLKDKFTSDSQEEIMKLKDTHENEISKLRNEYEKQLNRKMQRNSTFDKNRDLNEVIKERNGLRKVNRTLRCLITELISYVNECETELNNTLWNNLDKVIHLDNSIQDESILNQENPDTTGITDISTTSKTNRHVHFAPDMSEFLDRLEDDSIIQNLNKSMTVELKTELKTCLDRLKTEASALLQMTSEKKFVGKSEDDQKIDDLLSHVAELEKEKHDLISELCAVQSERDDLKIQLVNTEQHFGGSKHEIISEGYGDHSPVRSALAKPCSFSELRKRAVTLLSAPVEESGVNSPLLQLFEDLCREGDRIYDEANQDRDDLQLQIEAADKQLRATRQFLEDQAAEREQERDDFTKEISELKEKIKERDKERQNHEGVVKEVEHLESQMRDMSSLIAETEKRKQEMESELKSSVDKICLLSDIIRELENQLEAKSLNEKHQEKQIVDLQNVNEEQHKSYEVLTKELLTAQHDKDVRQLNDKICNLEDQLHSHRQSTENTEAVLQIKKQIEDIGTCIDLKTKLLETLHAAVYSTSCSSEDVSLRDRKVQQEDEKQKSGSEQNSETSPVAALEHLQQIQDKLQRHSKAEEATLKRIRDLEMQIATLKQSCSELRSERDILQERSQQQIIDLSSLQSRLDDQRRRADSIHKQSTSDLHLQIHNLQSELATTQEQLVNKTRRITNLEQIVEETRLRIVENESKLYNKDSLDVVTKLNLEIDSLKKENKDLKDKVKSDRINKMALPDLMDTMLEEKNADIDLLKEKLDKKSKDLDKFLALRLTEEQLNELVKAKELQDGKLSARTLSDVISISDYDEPDVMRKAESRLSLTNNKPDLTGRDIHSPPFSFSGFNLSNNDDIQFRSLPCTRDCDLKDVKPPVFANDFFHVSSPRIQNKLDLIPENEESVSDLQNDLKGLREALKEKSELLRDCEKQLMCVPALENEMQDLRVNLQETLKIIEDDKARFQRLIRSETELKEKMERLNLDLMEKFMEISELKDCIVDKDERISVLMQEKDDILRKINEMQDLERKCAEHEDVVNENLLLKSKLDDKDALNNDELNKLRNVLQEKNQELSTLRDYTELLKLTIKEKSDNLDIVNKEVKDQLNKINQQNENIQKLTHDLMLLKTQQSSILETKNADAYKHEIKNRDNEILHQRELLQEKEKIISHMAKDSENLHRALENIQQKLQESGNVLDLATKLKEEITKNDKLVVEIEHLRNMLSRLELNASPQPVDDIVRQVRKELDESAKLDSSLIQVIESDEFLSDDDQKHDQILISENELLKAKLDDEIKRNVKLLTEKQTLLIDLKNIEDKFRCEQESNKHLQSQLQNEIERSNEMQLQDADIMEAMRLRLEKALDEKSVLENLLQHEKNHRTYETDKKSNRSNENEFEPLDDNFLHDELIPEAKRLRKDLEIQSEINDRLTSEILLLKTQVDLERGKVDDAHRLLERERGQFEEKVEMKVVLMEGLKNEVEVMEEQKNSLTRELYEANQRSVQQRDRIVNLESRIKTLQMSEMRRNHRRDRDKQEQIASVMKQQELQTQTSSLEARLSSLQNELDRAIQRELALRDALNQKQDSDVTGDVPAQFLNKLKEMSTILEKHVSDNKQFGMLGSNKLDGSEQVTLESYHNALDRANHVFGKYLRSESYRKALTWQKNYLLLVQRSYEKAENVAVNALQIKVHVRNVSPKERFRIAVLSVMAISRMQFLVRRWHIGKMIGGRMVTNHKKRHTSTNYNVWNIPQSPPCRDKDRSNLKRDRNLDAYTKYDSTDRTTSPDIHKYL